MPPKRKCDYAKMASSRAKVWKETPPGPEQRELDRLFQEEIITGNEKPSDVQRRYPIFQDYSAKIFGLHYRKTTAKHGLCATADNSSQSNQDGNLENSNNKQVTTADPFQYTMLKSIAFENAPYCVWSYTNHVEKSDYVCAVIPVVSGSRDVSFVLSEDGLNLEIHYVWPKEIYDPSLLFEKSVMNDSKKMPMDHPKIHSFVSHLLELGVTAKSKPKGKITIELPQRETGSWTKTGLKINETKIVFLEFKAYTKIRKIGKMN